MRLVNTPTGPQYPFMHHYSSTENPNTPTVPQYPFTHHYSSTDILSTPTVPQNSFIHHYSSTDIPSNPLSPLFTTTLPPSLPPTTTKRNPIIK